MRRLIVLVLAVVVCVGAGASKCTVPENSHPNAPQVPGPERGGHAAQPPGTPNPQADPGPTNPKRRAVVRAGNVEAEFLPANVYIFVNPINGEYHDVIATPNSIGEWVVDVPDGEASVDVGLIPAKPGSQNGFCQINEGLHQAGPGFIHGKDGVHCKLLLH